MPGEVFYWVFNMSLLAAFMGLPVLLLRAVKRIPRRITVFLWAVPFLRMGIPVGLNNPYSLLSLIARFTTRTVTVYQPADVVAFSMTNSLMAADSYFPITYKAEHLDRVFAVAAQVWFCVALALTAALGMVYFTTLREVKNAKHLRRNIYLSKTIQGPAVYGILRPKILLPASYASEVDPYILQHESTHIRHGDNLWRLLALLLTTVHWFNPFSWLFFRLLLQDLELACDESVLARCSEDQRKAYARSLLHCAESRRLFPSAFGGDKLRKRIERILSFKKMTGLAAAGFSLLITAILVVLLTNAA